MKYVYKALDYAVYLSFGVMLLGAFMIVAGFSSLVLTLGMWGDGFVWLANRGGFIFGIGFFCLMTTGVVGVVTGYLK